jgi:hypothetical protein
MDAAKRKQKNCRAFTGAAIPDPRAASSKVNDGPPSSTSLALVAGRGRSDTCFDLLEPKQQPIEARLAQGRLFGAALVDFVFYSING